MRMFLASRRMPAAVVAGALSFAVVSAQAQAPQPTLRLVSETPYPTTASASAVTAEELHDIAVDAYIYAYPMVLMELTRRHATNVQSPIEGRAPVNQFGHRTAFPDARTPGMVWPSTDALYSSLWYDVSREPLIVRIPDSGGRYYTVTMLDMWTDVFASRGSRTTGNAAQAFAIVGPDWAGTIPSGIDVVRSPTASGWLISRVQTGGVAEYAAVNQFQAGMSATPLSQTNAPYAAVGGGAVNSAFNTQASPVEQVASMDAATYFTLFAQLLRNNPPHANDYPILDRMRRIGLGVEPFAFNRLDPAVQQALQQAGPEAGRRIADQVRQLGTAMNGWRTVLNGIGTYGADYKRRAAVAYAGLGADTPEDVIYPVTISDNEGKRLDSAEDYVLHFDKGQLPPTHAFWSLILYDARQGFAENQANRYAIRSTDPLKFNGDGSLDIYIQRDYPGKDKAANWLPAPQAGNFMLNMRVYWPQATALDGQWAPPPVRAD